MHNLFKKRVKGFTLIELLVVIAVLGILVLMAMPKFKDHIEKAHLANIQNDVKVAEGLSEEYLINDNKLPDDWESVNIDELIKLAQDKKLYDVKGLVEDGNVEEGEYVKLTKDSFNTKLKGNFYANQGGKVYYEDLKVGKGNGGENNGEKPGKPNKDDLINKKEEAEGLDPDDYIDWSEIQDAIDNADKIIEDEDATQDEVDDALRKLEDALDNLIDKPVNKSDLINKKEEAEGLDPDDYIDWSEIQDAIDNADKIIEDEDATQDEVDDALKKLEDAMDNLKEIPKYEVNENTFQWSFMWRSLWFISGLL